jgi:hypothetical protein
LKVCTILILKLPEHFDHLHLRAGGQQASVPDALENPVSSSFFAAGTSCSFSAASFVATCGRMTGIGDRLELMAAPGMDHVISPASEMIIRNDVISPALDLM